MISFDDWRGGCPRVHLSHALIFASWSKTKKPEGGFQFHVDMLHRPIRRRPFCGHASAVATLARFGSAAQGDPIYDAGVQFGRLLRTAFLADYFVKDAFRNELRRVLNRGEAINALKRAIYTGRISPAQAKRVDEMQAVADALSLLANIVMAWNTSQMQSVLNRWSNRRQPAAH